jgi:hypothetical protein
MKRDASYHLLGADFDYTTGSITYEGDGTSTGLSIASTTTPETNEEATAIAEAEADACERYVDPYGDDVLRDQGYDISGLMRDSIQAAMVNTYSDEYIAAHVDVDAWVDENAPSFDGVDVLSDEWDEVSEERSAVWSARWEDKHSKLKEEEAGYAETGRGLLTEMFTSENVRAAQDFFIEQCGIEVPDDYQYPTAEQLNIVVDEDFVSDLDERTS